jgi:hypothetical protein
MERHRDPIANFHPDDCGADLDDRAGELAARDHR